LAAITSFEDGTLTVTLEGNGDVAVIGSEAGFVTVDGNMFFVNSPDSGIVETPVSDLSDHTNRR
jgi:hypothetical protein